MESLSALAANQMIEQSKQAESLLKILANANRLMILCLLIKHPLSVNQMVDIVGLSQSAISQHLAKLREAKIVTTMQTGTQVEYRIESPEVNAIVAVLQLIYCPDNQRSN
jgi:DNA-binding transcriptional ArsR family regulator